MKTVKTRGLVIRSLDYKDTSKIVYVLTPLGLLSIRALGTKSFKNKNYNFCEVLSYVTMEITDSTFPTLIDFSIEDKFSDIKEDISKFFSYSYLLEFLTHIPENIPYEKTLDFTLNIIKLGRVYDPLSLILMLQIKFLPLFGIKPNTSECMICKSNKVNFISVGLGGGLCSDHRRADSYDSSDFILLYNFNIKENDFDLIKNINKSSLLNFINDYYSYHAFFKLKCLKSLIIK